MLCGVNYRIWSVLQLLLIHRTVMRRHLIRRVRNHACMTSPPILKTRHWSSHKQILLLSAINLKWRLMRIAALSSGGSHTLVPIQPLLHWLASIWQHLPQLFHVRDCFQHLAISSTRSGLHCHHRMSTNSCVWITDWDLNNSWITYLLHLQLIADLWANNIYTVFFILFM